MIVRHGTRQPSLKNIVAMKERLPQIKKLLINNSNLPNEYVRATDLESFHKWESQLKLEDEHKLAHEGEEEMLLLAERMQSRFPVLDNVYSNSSFQFKYTYSQRTKESAYNFVSGLFGRATAKDVWFPEPSEKDPILRFYKSCTKWKYNVKDKVKYSGEHKKFENSSEFIKVVENVNHRLGLKDELKTDDVSLIYVTCGFETAWKTQTESPWCLLLTEENLKVLEYREDLKYYWQDGYGYELTYKQACPMFGNMINMFQKNSSLPRSVVYFTHSGTLLKMLAHLGLYKDEQVLTSENFRAMDNRQWRTSQIDAFGTNLAFVLYDCRQEKMVLTLHQEHIVRLPSCPDSDLCELKTLVEYYSESINSCDFNHICENS
ncbi:multiple inositol polyphosphate phosphatase 1 isoform X2 [Cylas formicarius]|nr:multiple inositol polyphosphate phosphatase 1 isoform X2 [Cylas formicarius]